MADECNQFNCLDDHPNYTEDYNTLKIYLCSVQNDIDLIKICHEVPPIMLAKVLKELSIDVYSMDKMIERLDARVVALESKVKQLGG